MNNQGSKKGHLSLTISTTHLNQSQPNTPTQRSTNTHIQTPHPLTNPSHNSNKNIPQKASKNQSAVNTHRPRLRAKMADSPVQPTLSFTETMWVKVKDFVRSVSVEHLRIVLWTVLGSSVLISLLTSVAMMNTTLRKIESYNQRTELAHQHELNYQKKILLAHAEGNGSPLLGKLSSKLGSKKSGSSGKSGSKSGSKKGPSGKSGSGLAKKASDSTSTGGPGSKKIPKEPKIPLTLETEQPTFQRHAFPSTPAPPWWWSSSKSPSSPTSHPSRPSSSWTWSSSNTASNNPDAYVPPVGEAQQHRLPKVLIVGVSKCGTRALLDYLALHPNVIIANKEVHFFNNVTAYNRGPETYKNTMPLSYSDQLTVEKSPDYFECEMCPERIIAVARYAKLLLILCNPVDRLVSQYMQLKEKNDNNGVPMPSFEEWAVDSATGTVRKSVASIRTGLYFDFISNWFRFFPRERVHVIDGAQLIKDPVGEMKKVETFLGLKPYLTSTDIYYNATKRFHCMYSRITKKSHCLGPSKGRPHIPVDPGVYQTLQNFYSPHNAKLKTNYHYFMSWL